MKEQARITVPVSLVVALLGAGGYTELKPLLVDQKVPEHSHPIEATVVQRLAQAETHIHDPRPHTAADERLRALESKQAEVRNSIKGIEKDLSGIEEDVKDIKEGQEQINRKFDALLLRIPPQSPRRE